MQFSFGTVHSYNVKNSSISKNSVLHDYTI